MPRWFVASLQAQIGYRLPQAAIAFGGGVGGYFALPVEPGMWAVVGLAVLGALAGIWGWRRQGDFGGVGLLLAVAVLGCLVAALRTHAIGAPVLRFRYYGPVEGHIAAIDTSASQRVRVVLEDVRLPGLAPSATPDRVRVSFAPDTVPFALAVGQHLGTSAHLSPPQGPTEPGGFDFQRHIWFLGIGAVGYSRAPPVLLGQGRAASPVTRLRAHLDAQIRARMPPETAGVTVAIATGNRADIPAQALENLRTANLAHLLAISGLHMGLLVGFVFMLARYGLNLVPHAAHHWPVKKIGACIALLAATFYLFVSGMGVATQRAYVMVAVTLCAVLADRRAITLRAVAIAALIILVFRPESLVGPGFQMSFAATIALVSAFRLLKDRGMGAVHRIPIAGGVLTVFLSSLVAGLATAPFSAAHFNMIGQYGLLANLLSVPVMGVVVMPLLVIAALLAPLGLDGLPLAGVHLGLAWILGVAEFVASLEGARRLVPAPPRLFLPLFAFSALWCVAWQGRARWIGVVGVCAAFMAWAQVDRPRVLIAEDGGLVGVHLPQGRALNKARGGGFVAQDWLANDGSALDQAAAAELAMDWMRVPHGDMHLVVIAGRGRLERMQRACTSGAVLVSNRDDPIKGPCRLIGPKVLWRTGALALYEDGRIVTARALQGRRPWVPGPVQTRLTLAP